MSKYNLKLFCVYQYIVMINEIGPSIGGAHVVRGQPQNMMYNEKIMKAASCWCVIGL